MEIEGILDRLKARDSEVCEANPKEGSISCNCGNESTGGSLEKIRMKMQQLREDLCARLRKRDRDVTESMSGGSQLADPPDDERGRNQKFSFQICIREARDYPHPRITARTRSPGRDTGGIKGLRKGVSTRQIPITPTIKPSSMADQELRKNKEPVGQCKEVASNGKAGLGARPMERDGPSHDRGNLFRTPVANGGPAPQITRYGDAGIVVTPVLPVNMMEHAVSVVALDLSKERAAMR